MELRRTRFWVLSLTVLSLACLLAISGCGAPREAGPSLSADPGTAAATSPPVPTPDPRPTPASSTGPARNIPRPVLPEVAKQNTKEGFEAFTQYWLSTVTYAYESGDTEPLRLASASSCKVCSEFLDEASTLHDGGGWAHGPTWTVENFTTDMIPDPDRRLLGRYLGLESPSADYSNDGSVKRSFPGNPVGTYQEIYAAFNSGRWTTLETGNL